MAYELSDVLVYRLKQLAEVKCDNDDPNFSVFNYEDGPDDAWEGGRGTGQVELARQILTAVGVEFSVPTVDEDED